MGKENRCLDEIKDLLEQVWPREEPCELTRESCWCFQNQTVEELYPDAGEADSATAKADADDDENTTHADDDIEASIARELSQIKAHKTTRSIHPVKLEVQCLLWVRLDAPIDPVTLVQHLSRTSATGIKRSRWTQRLTPVTSTGSATESGLAELAAKVLAPHFHTEKKGLKFAIRTSFRNHSTLTRDLVIQSVAKLVGEGHSVDLKNYDKMILVDVFKMVVGMAVVDADFDKLKRFNLSELW
jgi:tRNA acetyltransferase TAN1